MTYVTRREGESIDHLIRRFRHRVMQSGILAELRQRQQNQKASDRDRAKRLGRERRRLADQRRQAALRAQPRILAHAYRSSRQLDAAP